MTLRKLHTSDLDLKQKKWRKEMGHNLNEKQFELIGLVKLKISKKLLRGFGVKILINDIKLKKIKILIKYLLKNSDIVSINSSVKKGVKY